MSSDPELVYLDRAIQRAEEARSTLDIEIQGLQLARKRLLRDQADGRSVVDPLDTPSGQENGRVSKVPNRSSDRSASRWRFAPRTDAILYVLALAQRPIHRKAIARELEALGRVGEQHDSLDAISAALAYLGRGPTPRVENIGGGVWTLASDSRPVADATVMTDPAQSDDDHDPHVHADDDDHHGLEPATSREPQEVNAP